MSDETKSKAERPDGAEATPVEPPSKPGLVGKLQAHFKEYGTIGIVTYFAIFFGTWGFFAAAITFGFEVQGAVGGAGTFGASYVATKLTQPIRIIATLALTPMVAAVMHRLRPRREALKAIAQTESEEGQDEASKDSP